MTAVLEMLGRMTAGCAGFEQSPSARSIDALTRTELAWLLAGLSRECQYYALAKYVDDIDSIRLLISHVQVYAAGLAADEGWRIVRGRPVITSMGLMSVYESVAPGRCPSCQGTGMHGPRVCASCAGSGRLHLSGRKMAEFCHVDESSWRRNWCGRYERLIEYLQDIEFKVKIRVKSNFITLNK